ncbi:DUF2877 domain-containing protein [Candidatus Bipolaricaulota bacterium]
MEQATRMGLTAQASLAIEGAEWRVLACVNGAIYLRSNSAGLLWVSDREAALHARAIEVGKLPPSGSATGTLCRLAHGILSIGDSLDIDLTNASIWEANWWPSLIARKSIIPTDLHQALSQVARIAPPQGGLAASLASLRNNRTGNGIETKILSRARKAIRECRRVSSWEMLPDVLDRCSGLIGLGSGLTPSGDDFLAAYLFTMKAYQIIDGRDLGAVWRRIGKWLLSATARTNVISSVLLLDCSIGEAAAPLGELVHSMLRGAEIDELVFLAYKLSQIGHSSGWDMLVGVDAAISAIGRIKRTATEVKKVYRDAVCRKEAVHVG